MPKATGPLPTAARAAWPHPPPLILAFRLRGYFCRSAGWPAAASWPPDPRTDRQRIAPPALPAPFAASPPERPESTGIMIKTRSSLRRCSGYTFGVHQNDGLLAAYRAQQERNCLVGGDHWPLLPLHGDRGASFQEEARRRSGTPARRHREGRQDRSGQPGTEGRRGGAQRRAPASRRTTLRTCAVPARSSRFKFHSYRADRCEGTSGAFSGAPRTVLSPAGL